MIKLKTLFVLAGFSLLFFSMACRRGDLVEKDRYIKFNLDAFIIDTSVYHTVKLNDLVLAAKPQIIEGTAATLVDGDQGVLRPSQNYVRLIVNVIKKNNPNLLFDDTIYISNVNDFLLLQLDPRKPAQLINKITEGKKYPKPGPDSVKVRFYFSTADRIRNAATGNNLVQVVDLQFYKLAFMTNGTPYAKIDTLIKGITINQFSEYYTFDKNIYGFKLLDGKAGLTPSQKLIQTFTFDDVDYFKDGSMEKKEPGDGLFQTLRIQRRAGTGPFIAKHLFSFK